MVESSTLRHRVIFLVILQVVISTFIAFYYYSESTNFIEIEEIIISPQVSLIAIFTKYLDPICKQAQNESYPTDCFVLLEAMINISLSLNLDSNEIEILSQRIQHLNTKTNHFQQPILYIHIPKTGGSGFGAWMSKHSRMKTLQLWIPDGMTQNMFDSNHYPKQSKNRRALLPKTMNQKTWNRTKKKPPFPQILYGHAAYGFDVLFLSPQQIAQLGANPAQIIWKTRLNYTYITILRHPLSRVVSHYFYHTQGKRDENHEWTQQRDLFGWISWFEESSECLVQFISGCHHRAWYNKQYMHLMDENLKPWPRRTKDRSPDFFNAYNISFEQYKIARNHLLMMPWVGLTEYLSQSVEQLKVFWQIKSTKKNTISKANVGRNKQKNQQLSQELIDKIKEYNKYDIALWQLGYVLYLQQEIVIKYGYQVDIHRRFSNKNENQSTIGKQ